MEREELIRKGNKLLLITLCVVVPILTILMFFDFKKKPIPTPTQKPAEYIEVDSSAYVPKKVKFKNKEKYENHTEYMISFEDGTEMSIAWNDWMKIKVGDSTNAQVIYKVKRLIN